MAAEVERQAITDLWPSHVEHLPPASNRLGQPFTDAEHGVVCNCGDVLGWPGSQPASTPAEVSGETADETESPVGPMDDLPGMWEPADLVGGEADVDRPAQPDWWAPEHEAAAREGFLGNPAAVAYAQAYERDQAARGAIVDGPSDLRGDPADEAQAERHQDSSTGPPGVDPGVRQAVEPGVALAASLGEDPPSAAGQLPARRADLVVAEDPIATTVTIIDPTLPYGPLDVEGQLIDIAARIERGVHFQRYWEERLCRAGMEFDLAHARALVRASGGDVGTRKAQALLDCEMEYREKSVCETMVRAVRDTMHNLRSLQSGYQTISRSVGAVISGPNLRP